MYSVRLPRPAIDLPPRCDLFTKSIAVVFALATVVAAGRLARSEDRTYDGLGNNIAHPLWGSAGADYTREASGAHYADGISAPQIAGLPSARALSNVLMTQGENSVLDPRNLTAMVYTWGQFIDHDMDLRASSSPPIAFNIPVPAGDPSFDPANSGAQSIPMSRSAFDLATGTSAANPAQQINTITSFLDASMVYGSNASRATWLRTLSGGQLKSTFAPTGALLPKNDGTQLMDGIAGPSTSASLFVAGDARANEQVGITAMQTLLMRENNRQATLIGRANPSWTDEQVYQAARKVTSAEMAAITYNEFLPALLGSGTMPAYAGYNANVDPSISNAFAAVAFRVGHSMLDDDIERVGVNGLTVPQGNLPLRNAFFNPGVVSSFGIDPMLRGFNTRIQQAVDPLIVDDIRNFLFGAPGAGGMDLAAIDIQRARDHGLADYNTMRQDFGLPKVTTFAQITSDPVVQAQLQSLYGSVDSIDAFVGALAEDHLPGSSVGPLTSAMLVDQFNRLRAGDRLFYLNDVSLTPAQAANANNFTLSELIRRNTFVRNIQDNAFVFGAPNLGSSWNLAGGGTWNSAANWTTPAQVPNGAGVTANFLTAPNSSSSISLDAPITVGTIVLSTASNVNLTPGAGGSLTLDNLGSHSGVLVSAGSHTISSSISLTDSLSALYYGTGGLNLSGNISESNAGRSIAADGSGIGLTGGGVTTISGTNSYTGGVQVTQSQLNLNSSQAQGAVGSVASSSNNGEIVLGFAPTAAHRLSIGDLGAIQGSNAQLAALNAATNLSLTNGALIVRQTAGGALPAGIGSAGNLYLGYSSGVSVTGANANLTVGATSGTAFKGIGAGRTGSYTWGTAADTLTLSGNSDFVSLGASTLTIAAKVAGGLANDSLTKRGSGVVKLTNAGNTFAADNVVVESGTLQYAYGTPLTFPAAVNFSIKPDATLQFNDGFTTTINGPVVNNGNIVKPAGITSQVVFKGGSVTGSGLLLSQDSQPNNSGPPNFIQATTAQILAHAFLFDNGQTNSIGGMGGFDPVNSAPILAVNGPNTSVHVTGRWDGDGSNQNSWLVVTNGGKVFIDSTAQLDTISDDGKLRGFAGRGDGTGVVEFADGFVANARDSVPDVVEFYVWSPGNFRWITHSDTNFPDSNIEINQEDGGTWSVQTRPQTLLAGLTTSRSFTIETQVDLTLGRDAAFHSFDGIKTITKTGPASLIVSGDWSIRSGSQHVQDTSLGTNWVINAGKFVTFTDMGQAATSPGANGVFGPPGLPDADDVVSTKFIYNVVVNNVGTIADFNASQHILSLKLNSGGQANLNSFAYGNGTPTTLQTDLLAVDAGTGALNIAPGNSATVRSGTGSFKLASGTTLKVQGGGILNINGTQTHGGGAVLNVAAGTANIATDGGMNLSITDAGIINLTSAQHLASVTVQQLGVLNVAGGDLNSASSSSNDGTISIASGRTATFTGNVTGAGNYPGAGTAAFASNFSPGNGPGLINFGGKANLTPTSTLSIELGGTNVGSQYDSLHVTGQLTLAGALAVSLINVGVYAPAPGDSFNVFDWGTLSGAFSTINLAPLAGGLTWDTSQLNVAGVLAISGLQGDYNLNGVVDAPDYVLWRKSLGQSGIALVADGNNDHTISQADYDIWRTHLGQTLGGGSGAILNSEVPEPSTAANFALESLAVWSTSELIRSRRIAA